MSSEDTENASAVLDKFADTIQKLEESLESWDLSTPGQDDRINDSCQHYALEAEGGVIERVITVGEAIEELGASIAGLDPQVIAPSNFEVANDHSSSPTTVRRERPIPARRSGTVIDVDEDDVDDEDLYNFSEILDDGPQSAQLSNQPPAPQPMTAPRTKVPKCPVDEAEGSTACSGSTQLTKPSQLTPTTSNSAPSETGYEEEEDLYNSSEDRVSLPTEGIDGDSSGEYLSMHAIRRPAEEPGTCMSSGREDSEGDYVSMRTEFSDPNRCLSVPILQPEKDLSRCICGVESGFDELRNEEGILVAIECFDCAGTWLSSSFALGSSHFKMTWSGAEYFLNVPIHINTTTLNKQPISSASELKRGDHITWNRRIYFLHSIVVDASPRGVKLMHWGLGRRVEIVSEMIPVSELNGVAKVLYEREDPVELVIARAARARVNGVDNYHIIENNCESFATFCKTGHFVSVESEALRKFYPGIIRVLDFFNFKSA